MGRILLNHSHVSDGHLGRLDNEANEGQQHILFKAT